MIKASETFLLFEVRATYEQRIVAFSLFLVFTIALGGQDQPRSQGFLCQYDVKRFQDIFGDLQAAKN